MPRSDAPEEARIEAPEETRIEREVKRDPNRCDTRIARAAHASLTLVRSVRGRLGLYPTGPS
jgi:hypothetical protein